MEPEQTADFNAFTDLMERRLSENDFKNGWEECETSYLVQQFREKIYKVNKICDANIINILSEYRNSKEVAISLKIALADISNYAMMIAGNVGRSIQ